MTTDLHLGTWGKRPGRYDGSCNDRWCGESWLAMGHVKAGIEGGSHDKEGRQVGVRQDQHWSLTTIDASSEV